MKTHSKRKCVKKGCSCRKARKRAEERQFMERMMVTKALRGKK